MFFVIMIFRWFENLELIVGEISIKNLMIAPVNNAQRPIFMQNSKSIASGSPI